MAQFQETQVTVSWLQGRDVTIEGHEGTNLLSAWQLESREEEQCQRGEPGLRYSTQGPTSVT